MAAAGQAEEDMVERLPEVEDIVGRLREFQLCDDKAIVGESCTDSQPSHVEGWINEVFRDNVEASQMHNGDAKMYGTRAEDQVVDEEEDLMLIQLEPTDFYVDGDVLYMRVASDMRVAQEEYVKRYMPHLWSST